MKIYVFESIVNHDVVSVRAQLLIDALIVMHEKGLTNYLHIDTKE